MICDWSVVQSNHLSTNQGQVQPTRPPYGACQLDPLVHRVRLRAGALFFKHWICHNTNAFSCYTRAACIHANCVCSLFFVSS